MNQEAAIVHRSDVERIILAMKRGEDVKAEILFEYSLLTKAEYLELQDRYKPSSSEPPVLSANKEQSTNPKETADSDSLWDQVLLRISSKISKPSYETWFSKTT